MATPGLEQLRDIHPPLPPHLALWQAYGEPLTLLFLGLLLVVIGWLIWRRYRKSSTATARRQARSALRIVQARYASDGDAIAFARDLDALLRREATRRYPGQNIRRLTGEDWLAFLDQTAGMAAFKQGAGRCLATLPYQRHGQLESSQIALLVARWLEH